MKLLSIFTSAVALGLTFGGCTEAYNPDSNRNNAIIATVAAPEQARTAVDGDPASDGSIGINWTDGDELGVFAADGAAQLRYQKIEAGARPVATFRGEGSASVEPVYAYYPYSADNDGKQAKSLIGSIPAIQDMTEGNIPGDYKYGVAESGNGAEGYGFQFQHLFSLIRVEVSASGTLFADDTLTEITYSATRGGNPVRLAGDFTFSAVDGTWATIGSADAAEVKLTWGDGASLRETITAHTSAFPYVAKGDLLTFTIKTGKGYVATFTAPSKVTFAREAMFLFPFNLTAIAENEEYALKVTDSKGTDVTGEFVGGSHSGEPEVVKGTFTCASYNVDGLPSIAGNSNGPGSSGTTLIGQAANKSGWDFFGASEDFEYNSQLISALTNYNSGKYRGSVSTAQIFGSKADTDGLNFFWKKDVTVTGETFIEYENSYGGLTEGANTCIKKGFRYYLVALADGTEIDVYITHMNTFSGSDISESNKYVKAVHDQTRQVANYIKEHKNGRPIIFMGDTNMRYTRHQIKTLLIDAVNADPRLTIVDPWVDLIWENDFTSVGGTGGYPLYGGKSLVVSDATGTNASTDIIISEDDGGLQKGEVVDKVFYINDTEAKTQIKATRYLRDVSFKKEDGKPLADHYPIVVDFEYER